VQACYHAYKPLLKNYLRSLLPLRGTLEATSQHKLTFQELYQEYSRYVTILCSRFASDPDDVADLVQEVFVKIYHALPKFDYSCKVSTWIYRIVTNRGLDYVSAHKSRAAALDAFTQNLFTNFDPGLSEQVFLRKILQSIVSQSAGWVRECVFMVFVEGFSHAEAAERLQLERTKVTRALQKFSEQFAKEYKASPKNIIGDFHMLMMWIFFAPFSLLLRSILKEGL
jgi:RNA polymerase sigma factor (sigma-70 family)